MAIVDHEYLSSYFGPFAGRTFLLMQSNGFNVNDATYSQLTAVTRIGQNRVLSLMSGRLFSKDCIFSFHLKSGGNYLGIGLDAHLSENCTYKTNH
ncbi:3947_t:CDS:2 [Funneliformis caledonium]|uniref:3947_t:CDS:1 n=1 Tax=Funneliformis caledonium TaxID=1117310 RepID=A0A9N8Z1X7_9GLOM|nr:3947_t:CDS:2 [Funneliformis caledonium]